MVTDPAALLIVSVIDMLVSYVLLPIVTSAREPNSAALEPAVALVAPEPSQAVKMVDVPVPLVCLIRIVPALPLTVVVSVSLVWSASLTVIHAVTAPPSVWSEAALEPVLRSPEVNGTG